MGANKLFKIVVGLCVLLTNGCAKEPEESSSTSDSRYLYVASGVCYSGNNTTFSNTTSSNLIYRLSLETGAVDSTIADYFSSPSNTGDSPASIVDGDSNYLYALIENTTTTSLRRIEKIEKRSNGARSIFSNNTTALSAQLRHLLKLSNGDFAVSKSTGVEYLTSGNVRLGAPYINATAAPCNTSTTLIPKVLTLSNGKFVFLHAAAAQNRFGIFATTGGTTCSAAQAAPNANAFPTAAFYDSTNAKLFVAYAGNAVTTDLNSIYMYSIDESTNAISGATKIYDASLYPGTYSYLLYGVSEMVYDAATSSVYIATATTTATTVVNYAIEKFTYDPTQIGVDATKILVRSGTTPFFEYGSDTKCISKMFIGN
ncbi:hypothetical protein [Pseudobdellovibrio sp. HCB154]|uniref:hypothetical protein n=1 Tax=Pseudobdellovibrio sp. HCB154 TaxID=3386277 RepID=UPI003916F4C5